MADFSFKEESIKAKANIVSSAMEKALEEIQKAERCIKKCIDIISDGDELEELDFPSQNRFYEEIEDDIYKIKRFGDLCWSYDREVDKPFADSYERLLEKVSQIKTEDIRIKNNIGVTEKEIYFINSSTVEERDKIKEEISFEDVLGYGDIGKLIKANYEIYLEQVGSETGYITLDDYISSMVKAGEFNYKIIPEWQEYLSLAIDCVPIIGDGKGILESIIGVDLITGRELSSLERGLSLLSVIPLIGDYAVIVKGAQKVVVKEVAESSIKGLTGVGLKKYAIKEGSKYALKAFNKEFLINSLTMVGSNALTGFGVSPVACLFLYQGGRITLKNWKKFKDVFGNTKGVSKAEFLDGYDSHLIGVEDIVRKGNKGVVGGHSLENFEQAFKDRGWTLDDCIISKKPHSTIDGIYEIEYRIPAINNKGEIIPGQYKNISYPKTVFDPSKISNEEILKWGKDAMQEGLNAGRISSDGRTITGFYENGLKFIGYIDKETGKITNFYPTLN